MYAIGDSALLAVVGDEGMNVARLHLEAKALAPRLAVMLTSTATPPAPGPSLSSVDHMGYAPR